jgi:hypothetical protein
LCTMRQAVISAVGMRSKCQTADFGLNHPILHYLLLEEKAETRYTGAS